MTPKQFQETHGDWLKSVIQDPKGQMLLSVMASMQPAFPSSDSSILFAQSTGKREGYESCLKMLILLSNPPKVQTEIEATYGVPGTSPM